MKFFLTPSMLNEGDVEWRWVTLWPTGEEKYKASLIQSVGKVFFVKLKLVSN